jgi:hypothetical protein
MVESPVSYLESIVPTVAYDIAIVFGPAGYACFYSPCTILFIHHLFFRHFLPTPAMTRRKITRDKLIARAKANSYKNSLRGRIPVADRWLMLVGPS